MRLLCRWVLVDVRTGIRASSVDGSQLSEETIRTIATGAGVEVAQLRRHIKQGRRCRELLHGHVGLIVFLALVPLIDVPNRPFPLSALSKSSKGALEIKRVRRVLAGPWTR